MPKIKALETVYRGNRFRSRLEARWAVFFHSMGIGYQYEPEGFDLGGGLYYLPDFYDPVARWWYEIKPPIPPKPREMKKARLLCAQTQKRVLLVSGEPWIDFDRDHVMTGNSYVMLRIVPNNEGAIVGCESIFTRSTIDNSLLVTCIHCIPGNANMSLKKRCRCNATWKVSAYGPRLARAYAAARSERFGT